MEIMSTEDIFDKPLSYDNDWIERLANQYSRRQMASLRGNIELYHAADRWLAIIASDHWHEIIKALRKHGAKT
jgi:hypothetical protein